jgi:hypothetical protein
LVTLVLGLALVVVLRSGMLLLLMGAYGVLVILDVVALDLVTSAVHSMALLAVTLLLVRHRRRPNDPASLRRILPLVGMALGGLLFTAELLAWRSNVFPSTSPFWSLLYSQSGRPLQDLAWQALGGALYGLVMALWLASRVTGRMSKAA